MDSCQLTPFLPDTLNLSAYRFGVAQRSGALTVLPVFGPEHSDRFTGPLSGIKLNRVHGYGNMELTNPGATGVAIVPLHMGYIQDQAQNHALCRSAFIAAGQKLMFEDACCVQAGQGGYLEGREQWFFVLPVQLRFLALSLRGQKSYSKLWDGISRLNQGMGLAHRGHLEQILSGKRAFLTQYQSRFELLPGQTGALFFLGDQLAGVEIAPNAAYFQELWMPLVCFCYGTAAMHLDQKSADDSEPIPFAASSLQQLRDALYQSRREVHEQLLHQLRETPVQQFELQEEERFLSLRLVTALGQQFAGQFVEEEGQLVYASLCARPEHLAQTA